MLTIGRRWRGRRGDFQATCAHCGVVWLRSKLRRDAAGSLTCPDEGDGLSATALSELNAQYTVPSHRSGPPGELIDSGGNEYSSDPLSILSARDALGQTTCRAWYQPEMAGVLGPGGYMRVPNLQSIRSLGVRGGDLYQPTSGYQPASVDGVPTFYGSPGAAIPGGFGSTPETEAEYLRSNDERVLLVGEFPCLWLVAAFDEVTGVACAASANWPSFDISNMAIFRKGDLVYGSSVVRYHAPGEPSSEGYNNFRVSTELTDTSLHVFAFWLEGDYLNLQVDAGEVAQTLVISDGPATSIGLHADAGVVSLGGGTGFIPDSDSGNLRFAGTIREKVVASEPPTLAQREEMRAYFKSVYPELNV